MFLNLDFKLLFMASYTMIIVTGCSERSKSKEEGVTEPCAKNWVQKLSSVFET